MDKLVTVDIATAARFCLPPRLGMDKLVPTRDGLYTPFCLPPRLGMDKLTVRDGTTQLVFCLPPRLGMDKLVSGQLLSRVAFCLPPRLGMDKLRLTKPLSTSTISKEFYPSQAGDQEDLTDNSPPPSLPSTGARGVLFTKTQSAGASLSALEGVCVRSCHRQGTARVSIGRQSERANGRCQLQASVF